MRETGNDVLSNMHLIGIVLFFLPLSLKSTFVMILLGIVLFFFPQNIFPYAHMRVCVHEKERSNKKQ